MKECSIDLIAIEMHPHDGLAGRILLPLLAAVMVFVALQAQAGCYCRMDFKESATNWNKVGFTELANPSIPPKLYLQKTYITTYNIDYNENSPYEEEVDGANQLTSEMDSYDINSPALNGPGSGGCKIWGLAYHSTLMSDMNGSLYFWGDGYQPCLSTFDNEQKTVDGVLVSCSGDFSIDQEGAPEVLSGSTCGSSPGSGDYLAWWNGCAYHDQEWVVGINREEKTTYNYVETDSGDGLNPWLTQNDSFKIVETLTTEYDDTMLRGQIVQRLPPYPADWSRGSGAAEYSFIDDDHACAAGSKMQYRLKVPNSDKNTTYIMQWQEVTDYPDGSSDDSTKVENIIGNGSTAYGSVHTVDMPQEESIISETAPDIISTIPTPGGGGNGGVGGGSVPGTITE